jgi:NAD+ kinase
MVTVGFVTHGRRPRATRLLETTGDWLRSQGHRARVLGGDGPDPWPHGDGALDGVALAVSLGGDGTMLRTVDLVNEAGIPVLGVNLGHLGYLTTVEPEELCHALERFLAGDYSVEARMTLDIAAGGAGVPGAGRRRRTALNDLVVTRPHGAHTVHASLSVGGEPFLSYAADSLIVASPTGSTAYNLSARGPIASPRTRVQIVTPVAPHMLFDRSLVLPAEEEIELRVTDDHPAELVVDGWAIGSLQPGEVLCCTGGRRDALFVTFGERNFHRILKQKFNLTGR